MRLNVRALAQTPRSANAEILRAASSFDLFPVEYVPVCTEKLNPRVMRVKSGQACDPLRRRVGGDVEPDEISAINPSIPSRHQPEVFDTHRT